LLSWPIQIKKHPWMKIFNSCRTITLALDLALFVRPFPSHSQVYSWEIFHVS
jgi:hypothetical protein